MLGFQGARHTCYCRLSHQHRQGTQDVSQVNSGLGGWLLSRTPDVIHSPTPQKTCQDRSGHNPIFTQRLIPSRGLGRKGGGGVHRDASPTPGQGSSPLRAGLRNREEAYVNLIKEFKMEGASHLETFSRISPRLSCTARHLEFTVLYCVLKHLLRG